MDDISSPSPTPLFSLPPPPRPPPDFSLSPPTPRLFHPFPPPTTPTAASPSSSAPHHRKKRTKFLRIDIPSSSSAPTPTPRTTTASKRPDPSAPKITRPCTECGKKFWSWKALFGHMRCHPERQWRGINPPPHLRRPPDQPLSLPPSNADVEEAVVATADDREVAASLLMLAGGGGGGGGSGNTGPPPTTTTTTTRESSAADVDAMVAAGMVTTRFECSSCKKTFGSHQALGGHRASHKNVKGCFAITKTTPDVEEEHQPQPQPQPQPQQQQLVMVVEGQNRNEVDVEMGLGLGLGSGLGLGHRCGVCLRVFSSGQALGGHMRCHWDHHQQQLPASASTSTSTSSSLIGPNVAGPGGLGQCGLDLNLPATGPHIEGCSEMQLDLRLGI